VGAYWVGGGVGSGGSRGVGRSEGSNAAVP